MPSQSFNNNSNPPSVREMMEAIRLGDLAAAKQLIAKGVNVNGRDVDEDTPLIRAAFCNRPEIARVLIGAGAHVNDQNKYGEMPIHYAASFGYQAVAALLIDKGTPLNEKNRAGYTPMQLAVCCNYKEIMEMLEHPQAARERLAMERAQKKAETMRMAVILQDDIPAKKSSKLKPE